MSKTTADYLIMHGRDATSLACRSADGIHLVLRAKTFVLAAGTYGSPMILMRSGIGPRRQLTELGIETQNDLPGVGKNLHDHSGISVLYEPKLNALDMLGSDLAEGRLYQSQVILRAKSRYPGNGFDLNMLPYQEPDEKGKWSFEILIFNMTPLSRGQVLLRGTDPELTPRIRFNYFSDQENHDLRVVNDGLHTIRRLSSLSPIANTVVRELEPGDSVSSEKDLLSYVPTKAVGFSHPVGTCKMGPASDPSAVVDATGLVRGANNLLSLMPQ